MTGLVNFDENLVQDVAARLDLRKPNEDGVRAVARVLAAADGYIERVVDVATGVGKTYLGAGIIEYAAAQGMRNVLIVTPSSRVQSKTIRNFTPGDRKYVAGSEFDPVIITPENFATGEIGTAIHDPALLKVFVFNVQQLLRPTAESSRKTREVNENLGSALYDHLCGCDDLLILADEHHIYRPKAKAFNAAIADLAPRALIGLTATPEPDSDVIFQYTLGEAIADGLVKIPVIAYRTDGIRDERTQLEDACRLLEAKSAAYGGYIAAMPAVEPVNPVLFVVCRSIEHAQDIAQLLAGSEFIGDPAAVLEVNSTSSDEALAALDEVEEPGSPIRAIVSVNMLKEGWDVKNIAVIVGLRRLASETLTEQVLGRGLRLPFGARTGVGQVDQIDIVSHDSWKQLLEQKDVLLERTMKNASSDASRPVCVGGPQSLGDGEPAIVPVGTQPAPGYRFEDQPVPTVGEAEGDGLFALVDGSKDAGVRLVDLDEHADRLTPRAPKVAHRRDDVPNIVLFPRREEVLAPVQFSLSQVELSAVRALGGRFDSEFEKYLQRQSVNVVREDGQLEVRVAREQSQTIQGELTSIEIVRERLCAGITGLRQVEKNQRERIGARALVDAFLDGAGVKANDLGQWDLDRTAGAVKAVERLVSEVIRDRPRQREYRLTPVEIPVESLVLSEDVRDLSAPFLRRMFYRGWRQHLFEVAAFDAKDTEWEIAQIVDASPEVSWWLRLDPRIAPEVYIPYSGGRYFPDFIACGTDGTMWLIEGKRSDRASDPEVVAKRAAAEEWCRYVTYDGGHQRWRYLFVTEQDVIGTPSWNRLVAAAAPE